MPWLLLLLPLIAAAANQLYLKRNAFIASMLSVASVAATFAISLMLLGKENAVAPLNWIAIGGFEIEIGLKLDQLATGMMVVVTGVGLLVHVFSLAYMADDSAKARFFTCLSLFMFSMTGIVLASNFIMTFMFWELVGLSSYLLIGHWYQRESAADAAKKAFITNRVGDFGFMIGILMLWGITGTLNFDDMKVPAGISTGVLGAALLCVFCGAVGKSAQMPLHVWLPDAMEGPTPVSALIHAATMVAAGVYMLFRLQLSIGSDAFDNFAGDTIAIVGGITALCAALMATQQNDIKRILAYSTLSQLGYMIMAVGLLAGEAGMFHLFTHAWFKALLFLGSGAVIHACHHQQDIWQMGGLLKKMPITGFTFLIGFLALIAVPGTAGFFSKEQILEAAHHHDRLSWLFWVAATVALLTPFYMTRLFAVAFLGKQRSKDADHAHEVGPLMFLPLLILAVLGLIAGYPFIAEKLAPAYEKPAHLFHFSGLVPITSVVAVLVGLVAGLVVYLGKERDPISVPLFRDRFRIDAFYDGVLVRYLQDAFAAIVHFFDEFLISGLIVGGSARIAEGFGGLFRRVQGGNLQGYAFAFGIGVILVIYFTAF
ncbi:MAG: NADH-quinone oxidoreductase subunit L [Verrucomicrobia bacterium]|nr:MAG: NADH-quinone oxidoreductase subunit L [Verrucomicrobiota bacterium]TAE89181.1 MAG: NADH-quinone oxidoreductase subunit L [Verrucomicrobiota bacterium]TAF27943.1 MAG: NADH-quinone oxidoreductase subunit L [Verrucomicrobiota bacterium]TAF42792.1 MAG: NADH-quinone oxidoreductase subunit L [Verrucomicrobiota bacterium]